ncbi:MAG: TonB-dependent receptor, partial [Rhodospirillales bacterium]|nr:TonB-dependent receptor [Rhodospirillales bacterium]
PHTSTNVAAGFAQGNYHLTDQLSATVGIRYAREEKEFKQDFGSYSATTGLISTAGPIRYTGNSVYYSTTPKFGLEYVPMDNVLVFGSVTRGFKSGGYNMTATLASVAAFAPEDLWSYEVGVKTDWLNKRLRVNLTGFYYDYSNMQVQAFIRPGVADITNAASATVKGLELELTAQPVQGLQLTANLAWLDGTYDSYPRAPGPGGTIVDASGNRINAAPKYSTNFAAEYDWIQPSGDMFFVRAEYFWQDRQFFVASNDPNQSQGAYGVLNASIGYEAPDARWRVALYGKNLTDRQYITITGTVSPVISGRPGDPRTFGVRGTYKF